MRQLVVLQGDAGPAASSGGYFALVHTAGQCSGPQPSHGVQELQLLIVLVGPNSRLSCAGGCGVS